MGTGRQKNLALGEVVRIRKSQVSASEDNDGAPLS
jgi:hypothetical protein